MAGTGRVQRYSASASEKAKRKARGNKLRSEMRARQARGNTGASSGKFTASQSKAATTPSKAVKSAQGIQAESQAQTMNVSTPETMNKGIGPTIANANAQNRPLPTMTARDIERAKSGELKVSDEVMAAINSGELTGEKESFAQKTSREFNERGGWQTLLLALGESGAIDVALGIAKNSIGAMGKLTAAMNKAGSIAPGKPVEALTNAYWKQMVHKGAAKGASEKAKRMAAKSGLNAVKSRIISETVFKKVMASGKSKAWGAIKIATVAGTVSAIIGQFVWGEWGGGEAREGLNYVVGRVAEIGDPELTANFIETGNEIYDTTLIEGIQRVTPGLNFIHHWGDKTTSLNMQWEVNKRYLTDVAQGGKPLDSAGIQAETTAMIEANQIRQIERQKEYKQWAIDADNADMIDDARFFRQEAEKKRAIADAERQKIFDFWIEYRKLILKMQEDNGRSNLNFGFM